MPAFIELCAGMAGVSMRLAGRNRLIKYRGGKWKLANDIIDIGGITTPSRYVWAEANPHARRFLQTFSNSSVSSEAVEIMRTWMTCSPQENLDRWHSLKAVFDGARVEHLDVSDAEFCASFFLWRQVEGHRRIPKVSYLGIPNPDAVRREDRIGKHPSWMTDWMQYSAQNFSGMTAEIHDDARAITPFKDAVVYVDPPYDKTLGYSKMDLKRDQVIGLARSWDEAGAQVMISEGEPLHDLVRDGWHKVQLASRGSFNCGIWAEEWLTTNREPWPEDFTGW